jgi:hypothetical protein
MSSGTGGLLTGSRWFVQGRHPRAFAETMDAVFVCEFQHAEVVPVAVSLFLHLEALKMSDGRSDVAAVKAKRGGCRSGAEVDPERLRWVLDTMVESDPEAFVEVARELIAKHS